MGSIPMGPAKFLGSSEAERSAVNGRVEISKFSPGANLGQYASGQRTASVKRLLIGSQVRILPGPQIKPGIERGEARSVKSLLESSILSYPTLYV